MRTRKYTDWGMGREGRKDGRSKPPIPHWDADALPPACHEVHQAGVAACQSIRDAWKAVDRTLHSTWVSAFLKVVHAIEATEFMVQGTAEAEERYERERGKRVPASDFRFAWYYATCVALALAEVPFNHIVFRAAGESEVLTLVFTLTLAAAVVFGSHWIGALARKRNLVGAVGTAASVLLVVGSIAWFRAIHMASAPAGTGGVRFDEAPTLMSYFSFNLLLVIVMAVYSWHVHDELLQEVFRWRKALLAAKSALRSAYRQFARAYNQRAKRHAQHVAKAENVSANVARLIEVYRKVSLRSRNDRDGRHYPKCFECYLAPELPAELTELTWECPQEARLGIGKIIKNKEIHNELHQIDPAFAEVAEMLHSGNGTDVPGAGPGGLLGASS